MARRHYPLVLATCAVMAGVALIGTAVYGQLTGRGTGTATRPSPSPSPTPPPPPTLRDQPVTVATPKGGFFAYAFYDRRTDQMSGSSNSDSGTNSVESMIKVWMVADYLQRHPTLTEAAKKHVSGAIRDSNNTDANWFYSQNGGRTGLKRLITTCGLKHTTLDPKNSWAYVKMTAQDAVRMGLCIADGTAAGPTWTEYLLGEMRMVRGPVTQNKINGLTGGGRWGIIDGLPANLTAQTSIKNGWTMLYADMLWHVNCLAIHPDWVLAVQVRSRYNQAKEKQAPITAATVCASVAKQLTYDAAAVTASASAIPSP